MFDCINLDGSKNNYNSTTMATILTTKQNIYPLASGYENY